MNSLMSCSRPREVSNGGIIEKLEAIQTEAKESLQKEIEEFEQLTAQPITED